MKKMILVLTAILVLSGCSHKAREQAGLVKSKPDETQILTQEQLVLPPDFDTIPVNSNVTKK